MVKKYIAMVMMASVLTVSTAAGVAAEGIPAETYTDAEADESSAWTQQDDMYMIPRTEEALTDFTENQKDFAEEENLSEAEEYEEETIATADEAVTADGPGEISCASTTTCINITGSDFTTSLSRNSYPYYQKMICVPTVHVWYKQTELTEGVDYSVTYANLTLNSGVGTYAVYINGKNAYTGTVKKTYKITAQKITSASLQTSRVEYDFDPKAEKKPAAIVKAAANPYDNELVTLLAGSDYTVQYKNNLIPGTATATVKGTGNYTGTVTLDFTITKASLSGMTVSLSYTSCSYTGGVKKPAVTVKGKTGAGKTVTLKAGTDYTVSYKNNTMPGTASVIVKAVSGSKYYSGSVTKKFKISIAKAEITSLTAGSGSFTAKWEEKASSKADGYQLMFSTDSTFKTRTVKAIKGSATNYDTEKGLTKGKTYYVRVRSYKKIGGVRYVSVWSAVKKVKIS